jgi:hypothetical protein
MSTFLQTALAAEAHWQFVHEGENLNSAKSLKMPYRNPEANNFQERRAEFETNVDVDQKVSV